MSMAPIAKIKRSGLDTVVLQQFYGGKKRGLCVFLNSDESNGFEFSKSEAQQLVKELQNWLGENELPFRDSFAGRLTRFPIPPYKGTREQQRERATALGLTDEEAIDMGIMSDEV